MRQRFWQGTFKTLGLLGLTAGLAAHYEKEELAGAEALRAFEKQMLLRV
ncbi:hypothetical protein HKT23_34100, partial [Pseudomonas aeruginosa]|nr:hypothetical protein [Pseudomonas aeruginosa]